MNVLKNERGHGMVYLLWIMVMSIAIFVIVVNIAKVYAVKQQAATATQQAALAGTSVLLEATIRGVKNFDDHPDTQDKDWVAQRGMDSKSVTALLDEKVTQLKQSGQAEDIAYIQAMNELLPSRIQAYELLEEYIKTEIDASRTAFTDTVKQVVEANDGNLEGSTVTLTTPEYRIEVIADVTYEAVTDSATSYIKDIVKEIPQKGIGPSMTYLKGMY